MSKLFLLLTLLTILSNCVIKNDNAKLESNEISKIKFNDELNYEQFKKNVIEYGKLSNFPSLDN